MTELSLDDYVGFLSRLRLGLEYYDGDEQEINGLIETASEFQDELEIIRDWTCLANEFRRGERKSHRTKRLNEYVKAMIKEQSRPEGERKPFAELGKGSIFMNLLVATASETQKITRFSETSVKYIINHYSTFIQRRKLGPYFIYLPYCQVLCSYHEEYTIGGKENMSEFETACAKTATAMSQRKKRKRESNDTTTEPRTAEISVVAGRMSSVLRFAR
ncbi:hypothetical protein FPRO04_13316 [Fusarium proliferatum]|nr:hypothetical protein FPRO04_13316 [Fusarium proliferatum]